MTEPTSSQPSKRSSWLRKLLFAFGGLLVLLVVAYFVVTSSAFFKGVILPRASKAIGGQITVADAAISPFSQVHLRQLKVQTTGPEPLLQAEEVRVGGDMGESVALRAPDDPHASAFYELARNVLARVEALGAPKGPRSEVQE